MKKATKTKKAQIKEKPKQEESNEYTKEEIERLDYFHSKTENKFDDDEIYDLMLKYKNDENAILSELEEQLKERKRGGEYEWQEVGKSKYIFNKILILFIILINRWKCKKKTD